MFRAYIYDPEGRMSQPLVTADLQEAERHFAKLCTMRTDGPAVAVLVSLRPGVLPTRRFRVDRDYPDERREQAVQASAEKQTYRACFYVTPDGQSKTVLTGPEHASREHDALIEEALAEAKRAGIICGDDSRPHADDSDGCPAMTLAQLREGLTIGDWTDD